MGDRKRKRVEDPSSMRGVGEYNNKKPHTRPLHQRGERGCVTTSRQLTSEVNWSGRKENSDGNRRGEVGGGVSVTSV